VDMLQWRICCRYVTGETVVDMLQYTVVNMLQWRLCCGYVTVETVVDMLQ
jgi:hypothetical protein